MPASWWHYRKGRKINKTQLSPLLEVRDPPVNQWTAIYRFLYWCPVGLLQLLSTTCIWYLHIYLCPHILIWNISFKILEKIEQIVWELQSSYRFVCLFLFDSTKPACAPVCVRVCESRCVCDRDRAQKKLLSYNGHIEARVRYKVPNWQFTEATTGHGVSQASV